jgi:hypothetical protein
MEASEEMIYDMYIYALYKKEKRNRDVMSNSQKPGEFEIESLVFERSDQKRKYFIASLCSVFPGSCRRSSPPPSSRQVGSVHDDAGGATTALAAVALARVVTASSQRL